MRITEILEYALPFAAVAIAVLAFILERNELWKRVREQHDVGPIVLVLVSLLCIAYGVERLTYSQKVDARLDEIISMLGKTPTATFTDNTNQIWSSLRNIVLGMEYDIRTIQSGDRPSTIPEAFKDLRERLADRMAEMRRIHVVRYRVVLVFDQDKSVDELKKIKEANAAVMALYESKGVSANVELRVFPHKPLAKFDILVVDSRHVNIGFDTYPARVGDNVQIQNAMLWLNQPALGEKLAKWFDESVWQRAITWDEWVKTH
jgi:hypothetical protein